MFAFRLHKRVTINKATYCDVDIADYLKVTPK